MNDPLRNPISKSREDSFARTIFLIGIDGLTASQVISVKGGLIQGIVAVQDDDNLAQKKQIVNTNFSEIILEARVSVSQHLAVWIADSLAQKNTIKSGEIIAISSDKSKYIKRNFFDAIITEVCFPELDSKAKQATPIKCAITPGRVQYERLNDKETVVKLPSRLKVEQWPTSNFRVKIGDLSCNRVNKIGSFSWSKIVPSITEGGESRADHGASRVELTNLKLIISSADSEGWEDWFQDFVVKGNNTPSQKVNGKIEFLDPTFKNVIGTIELGGLGIVALNFFPENPSYELFSDFEVELYMESIRIVL